MAERMWHYARDGQQSGPVAESGLKQMAESGQLRPTDLVWTDGMGQWAPAGQVGGLFAPGASAVATAPLPSAPLNYATPARPANIGDDPGMRWLLPVGRSGWAIAAGYLGLFALTIVPAPLALVIGIVAVLDIRHHPERHGMGRAIFGIVTGVLGTALLLFMIIAVVASH